MLPSWAAERWAGQRWHEMPFSRYFTQSSMLKTTSENWDLRVTSVWSSCFLTLLHSLCSLWFPSSSHLGSHSSPKQILSFKAGESCKASWTAGSCPVPAPEESLVDLSRDVSPGASHLWAHKVWQNLNCVSHPYFLWGRDCTLTCELFSRNLCLDPDLASSIYNSLNSASSLKNSSDFEQLCALGLFLGFLILRKNALASMKPITGDESPEQTFPTCIFSQLSYTLKVLCRQQPLLASQRGTLSSAVPNGVAQSLSQRHLCFAHLRGLHTWGCAAFPRDQDFLGRAGKWGILTPLWNNLQSQPVCTDNLQPG